MASFAELGIATRMAEGSAIRLCHSATPEGDGTGVCAGKGRVVVMETL
jgi:hypothetical protein